MRPSVVSRVSSKICSICAIQHSTALSTPAAISFTMAFSNTSRLIVAVAMIASIPGKRGGKFFLPCLLLVCRLLLLVRLLSLLMLLESLCALVQDRVQFGFLVWSQNLVKLRLHAHLFHRQLSHSLGLLRRKSLRLRLIKIGCLYKLPFLRAILPHLLHERLECCFLIAHDLFGLGFLRVSQVQAMDYKPEARATKHSVVSAPSPVPPCGF